MNKRTRVVVPGEDRWRDGMSLGNNKQVFDPVGFVIRADGVCRLKNGDHRSPLTVPLFES
jgi:hypothetical protein